jgi:hypothetical protein
MGKRVAFYDLRDEGFVVSYTAGIRKIEAPAFSEVLRVQSHRGAIGVWMLVDEKMPLAAYAFRVAVTFPSEATWANVPDKPGRYLGSVDVENAFSAVHVFEVDPRSAESR